MADSSPGRAPPPQLLLQPGSQILSSNCLNKNYMVVFCYEILDIFSRLCPSDTETKCELPSFFFFTTNIWEISGYMAAWVIDGKLSFVLDI